MVLTGTDPKRGKHGGDVHFKEDAAVFICLCTNRVKKRENMTLLSFSIFFSFFLCVCVSALVYSLHEIELCA